MRTIIDALTAEHALFNLMFDEINQLLPDVHTVAELRLLTRLVEGLLTHHANLETNLAYATLDHALAAKGQLKQLYQDHNEIDACFRAVALTPQFAKAVRLLKAGLKASRKHFAWEEKKIFPLFERLLPAHALEALCAAAINPSPLGEHGFANALRAKLQTTPQ
jgi:hemerythrin-like domain-containing protein